MHFIDFDKVRLTTKEQFWESIDETLESAAVVLLETHFETEEEARTKKYRNSYDPHDMRVDTLFVHRYRRSDDRAGIQAYREDGIRLLDRLKEQIEKRKLTHEFIHNWGQLMFCFGFVCVGIFALANEASHLRAGHAGGRAVSTKAKRIWVARLLRHFMSQGQGRKMAEESVTMYVREICSHNEFPRSFDKIWFDSLLDKNRWLKSSYLAKNFYNKDLESTSTQKGVRVPRLLPS